MSEERDDHLENGGEWTKEEAKTDRRFDFAAFLGPESLEDQVTKALDGKDLLDKDAYGTYPPGYIPRRAAPGDRGRHEAPEPEPEEEPEEEMEEEEYPEDDLPTQRFSADGEDVPFRREQREEPPRPSPIRDEPPPRPKVVVATPTPPTVYVSPHTEYDDGYGGGKTPPPKNGMGKGMKVLISLLITVAVVLAAGALIVTLLPSLGGQQDPGGAPAPSPTDYLFGGLPTRAPTPPSAVPTAPPVHYTVSVTAGSGGTVSPSGSVDVLEGGSVSFTITPNDGYELGQLLIDGSNVSVQSTYTFSDVRGNHTIYAVFQQAQTPPPPPSQTEAPTPEPTAVPTEAPTPEPVTPEPVEPPPAAEDEVDDLVSG